MVQPKYPAATVASLFMLGVVILIVFEVSSGVWGPEPSSAGGGVRSPPAGKAALEEGPVSQPSPREGWRSSPNSVEQATGESPSRIHFLDSLSRTPVGERLSIRLNDPSGRAVFEGDSDATGLLVVPRMTSSGPKGVHRVHVEGYRIVGKDAVDLGVPADQWLIVSGLRSVRVRIVNANTGGGLAGAIVDAVEADSRSAEGLRGLQGKTKGDYDAGPIVKVTDSAGEADLGTLAVGTTVEVVVSAMGYETLVAEIVPVDAPDGSVMLRTLHAVPTASSDVVVARVISAQSPGPSDRWELHRKSDPTKVSAGWPSFHRIGVAQIGDGIQLEYHPGGSDRLAFDVWFDDSEIHYDCHVVGEPQLKEISLPELNGLRSHFVLPAEGGAVSRLQLYGTVAPIDGLKNINFTIVDDLGSGSVDAGRLDLYVPSCRKLEARLVYVDGREVRATKSAFMAGDTIAFGTPKARDLVRLTINSALTLEGWLTVTSSEAGNERIELERTEVGEYTAEIPRSCRYLNIISTHGISFMAKPVSPIKGERVRMDLGPEGLVACTVHVRDDQGRDLPFFPLRLIPDPNAPERVVSESDWEGLDAASDFEVRSNDILFRRTGSDGHADLLVPPGLYLIDQRGSQLRTLGSGLRRVLRPQPAKLSAYEGMAQVDVVFESLRNVTLDFGEGVHDLLPLEISSDWGWRRRVVSASKCTLQLGSGPYSLYISDRNGERSGPVAIDPGSRDLVVPIDL
jgi:hypothetical protein